MQLVYLTNNIRELSSLTSLTLLIDIFEDNQNIEQDRSERDSVNVMKNRLFVTKDNFNFYPLGSVTSVDHGNCH